MPQHGGVIVISHNVKFVNALCNEWWTVRHRHRRLIRPTQACSSWLIVIWFAQVVNGGGITHHDKPPNQEEIQTQE